MNNLIDNCLQEINVAQRKHRANGDKARAISCYYELLGKMLEQFENASALERQAIRLKMSREGSGLLLGAAEGSAELAVREHNPQRLQVGLAALLVENLKEDNRETIMALTLLYNAAKKLSTDLQALYNNVRHLGEPETLQLFDTYFAQGGKSLFEMGFYESINDAGEFCYSRNW
jgi:hypothetical protein